MEKISRERECKAEYEAFKECLAIHFDPERGANKDITVGSDANIQKGACRKIQVCGKGSR